MPVGYISKIKQFTCGRPIQNQTMGCLDQTIVYHTIFCVVLEYTLQAVQENTLELREAIQRNISM